MYPERVRKSKCLRLWLIGDGRARAEKETYQSRKSIIDQTHKWHRVQDLTLSHVHDWKSSAFYICLTFLLSARIAELSQVFNKAIFFPISVARPTAYPVMTSSTEIRRVFVIAIPCVAITLAICGLLYFLWYRKSRSRAKVLTHMLKNWTEILK